MDNASTCAQWVQVTVNLDSAGAASATMAPCTAVQAVCSECPAGTPMVEEPCTGAPVDLWVKVMVSSIEVPVSPNLYLVQRSRVRRHVSVRRAHYRMGCHQVNSSTQTRDCKIRILLKNFCF